MPHLSTSDSRAGLRADAAHAARPQTTIVLTVYNGETFLAQTIESALAQTVADFELLVVDDGSTDGSLQIVSSFERDDRVRVIRKAHGGPAETIQMGVDAARGQFVAFLDQDDLWEADYLESQVHLLESRPEIAVAFTWFRIIDEHQRDTGLASHRFSGTVGFEHLLTDFVIGGNSNVVARRSAIEAAGGVDVQFLLFYNVDLCLRIALLESGNICAISRDLMRYRRHAGQMSRDVEGLAREWDRLLRKFESLVPDRVSPVKRAAGSNELRYFARVAYEGERYAHAMKFLARGFSAAPVLFVGDRRNWLTAAACLSGLVLPRRLHGAAERMAGFRRGVVREAR